MIKRILVCGGRDYKDYDKVSNTLYEITKSRKWYEPECFMPKVHIISGATTGADTLAVDWAVANWCPYTEYPADWKKHGKKAGMIRNQQMIDETPGGVDLVVAFPGGRGTADMIRRAKKAEVGVIEI